MATIRSFLVASTSVAFTSIARRREYATCQVELLLATDQCLI
jgi:hypothetical protein